MSSQKKNDPQASELLRPGRWDPLNIDFGRWNLMRVYGEDWRPRWDSLIGSLLRDGGFNTIGNWSSRDTALATETPLLSHCLHFRLARRRCSAIYQTSLTLLGKTA